MIDVLSLGEPLVQLNPLEEGPLRHVHLFDKHTAGSEVNVLIGVSRLGFKTSLITRLGKDEFSQFVLATLKSEGVGTEGIKQFDGKNCGVFFVQRDYPIPEKSDVVYYRSDSAAKYLSSDDIDESMVKESKILHVTGITPALSESCKKATFRAVSLAKENNVKVSFDPNYRKKLWSEVEAEPVMREIAKQSDLLFVDTNDARMILGRQIGEVDETLKDLLSLGPQFVVLKLGARRGLAAISRDGKAKSFGVRVRPVDSIGAGDAVVAGFLAGYLGKEPLQKSLDMAECCATLVVLRRGDYENLPDKQYLDRWLAAKEQDFDLDLR
ncbi:MAG: sugar kinase [Nitrososphaerota archaeon]|nr:sugar kinase [Nitrososphaerota archaeon]